jgi:hypothetical protein
LLDNISYPKLLYNKKGVKQLPIILSGLKGIVSPDWKGLQMISLDRFEV